MATDQDERRGRVAYEKAAGVLYGGKSWETLDPASRRFWVDIARAVALDIIEGPAAAEESSR